MSETILQRLYNRLGWTDAKSFKPLSELRREAAQCALEDHGGKKCLAALALGISGPTLNRYLRGLGVLILFASTASAQIKGAALLIPATAPTMLATNKTRSLTWNSSESSFAVYTGSSRQTLSNRQVIAENKTRYTNGVHYGIAAINQSGIESTLAYWPSNRVAELWLRGYGSNLSEFTNIFKLAEFTNNPPGTMRFWGIADVTTGWK